MVELFESMQNGHFARTNVSKHRINLISQEVMLIHSGSYFDGPGAQRFPANHIDMALTEEFIDSAIAEWASSPVFAPIKYESPQLYVDYRNLYAATARDSHRLPHLDQSNDSSGDAMIFSTLKASSEYWPIEIEYHDRKSSVLYHLVRTISLPTCNFSRERLGYNSTCDRCLPSISKMVIFLGLFRHHCCLFKNYEWNIALVHRVLQLYTSLYRLWCWRSASYFTEATDHLDHVILPDRLELAEHTTDRI